MQRFDEEAFGGLGIACRAQEKLKRVAFRVDGSVEGCPPSFDLDGGFIDAPGVIGGFEVRPAALLQFGGRALHPAVDRRVIDLQFTFPHHFLQITVAERVAQVPPDTQENDLGFERNAPRRQWYIWADPQPGGSPPNNWVSLFGGSAWEWDAATGQYYLHSFDKRQPDLNWRNPEVQAAMFDILRFWLDHAVDGFRIDAAHMIMKDPQLRDNPPNLTRARVMPKPMGDYDVQLHVYDKAHPDVHGIYRALRRLLDSYGAEHPRVAIGEMHILDWKVWASYYGANLDEMHMPFNFGLVNAAWNAQTIRQSVDTLEAVLVPGAWPNYVLGNHDEPRIVSRVGPAQARLAMLLLLTLRGTPMLYYGDEIGMHDGDIPPEHVYDPMEKNRPGQGLGRDPERTPMQWDRSPNAGFCPPGTEPWLPIPADYQQINVAVEREDPHSLLTLTRRLIELRCSTPALTTGQLPSHRGST